MLNTTTFKKIIGNHLKILTSSMLRNNATDDNYLQIERLENTLHTMSVGYKHTLMLTNEFEGEDTGLAIVDPNRLNKTLPYMGDDLNIRFNEKDLDFYNDNSQVKLYKLGMQEDYKVSVPNFKQLIARAESEGVKVGKEDFFKTIRRLMDASGEIEDVELYNVVSLNFKTDGKAFTGSNTSYFRTDFNLGGKSLVIDKPTAALILGMDTNDAGEVNILIDESSITYVCGGNVLKVDEVSTNMMDDDKLQAMDSIGKTNKVEFDINNFKRLVNLATTLAEEDVIDVSIKEGSGVIKSGVGGENTDFSKGEFSANEEIDIDFSIEAKPLLDVLNVIENNVGIYINEDVNVMVVESEDEKDYAVIQLSDI